MRSPLRYTPFLINIFIVKSIKKAAPFDNCIPNVSHVRRAQPTGEATLCVFIDDLCHPKIFTSLIASPHAKNTRELRESPLREPTQARGTHSGN